MRYTTVTKQVLSSFGPTLGVLERINDESLDIFLYGLSRDPGLLAKAEDALEYFMDGEGVEVPKLTEVAVCIPLGEDILYYLEGSGLILRDEEFAYLSGSDAVRTNTLRFSGLQARVAVDAFTEMAIATSDSWIDDFLTKHGTAVPEQEEVSRDESATKEEKPKASVPPPTPSNPIDNYLNS